MIDAFLRGVPDSIPTGDPQGSGSTGFPGYMEPGMQVVKSVRQQSCVDGSLMRILHLDKPVTRDFLKFLSGFGSLVLLDDTEGSFFTLKSEDVLSVMGFLGDASVEVKNPKAFQDITENVFSELCRLYLDGRPDYAAARDLVTSVMDKIQARKAG
jgi:hypothetical protein